MAQTQIFRGTARRIQKSACFTDYIYHNTAVVTVNTVDGTVRLDSGGYRTATTKTAMNQASNQYGLGFGVYQKAHEWFVTWKGQTLPFSDGMILQKKDFSEDEGNN